MNNRARVLLLILFAAWMAAWLWFFSFQYSSSFFQYHLGTRLPFLTLSMLVVVVAPLSGYFFISRAVRGVLGAGRAALFHALVSASPVGLFWCVSAVCVTIARHGGWLAFEADEAMGIGIDFLVCIGVVLLSYLVVGFALMILAIVRRTR